VLAQRAVADSPRWTRAVEDQSAPIPEEITSELGGIIYMDGGRSMRAVGDNPDHRLNKDGGRRVKQGGRAQGRIDQAVYFGLLCQTLRDS